MAEENECLLIHNNIGVAPEKGWKEMVNQKLGKKDVIKEQAHTLIILNLSNEFLRKVDGKDAVIDLWDELERRYLVKDTPNLVFLQGTLLGFEMDETKTLDVNLDEFQKLSLLLKDFEQALKDESLAIILLNSVPNDYKVVKDAMLYKGKVPELDVKTTLRARDYEFKMMQKSNVVNIATKSNSFFESIGNVKRKMENWTRMINVGVFIVTRWDI